MQQNPLVPDADGQTGIWKGADLAPLIARTATRPLGKIVTKWIAHYGEVRRLKDKREEALNVFHDSVLAMRLNHRIGDISAECERLLEDASRIDAQSIDDTLCKMALWRMAQCPLEPAATPDARVAASVFDDLVRFASEEPEASTQTRAG